MVCVAVWRRRRGFIGGTGGVSIPLVRLAPGGKLTVGTLYVEETRVGSEICILLTIRFWRPELPAARCEMTFEPDWKDAGVEAAELSDDISYSGGVVLAE